MILYHTTTIILNVSQYIAELWYIKNSDFKLNLSGYHWVEPQVEVILCLFHQYHCHVWFPVVVFHLPPLHEFNSNINDMILNLKLIAWQCRIDGLSSTMVHFMIMRRKNISGAYTTYQHYQDHWEQKNNLKQLLGWWPKAQHFLKYIKLYINYI